MLFIGTGNVCDEKKCISILTEAGKRSDKIRSIVFGGGRLRSAVCRHYRVILPGRLRARFAVKTTVLLIQLMFHDVQYIFPPLDAVISVSSVLVNIFAIESSMLRIKTKIRCRSSS